MALSDDYSLVLVALLTRTGLVSHAPAPVVDVAGFEALVRENSPALQRLMLGYEASPHARQDLYQDILAAAWRALPRFEGRSSQRTWLFRIAHNVAATHVLRARRRGGSSWQDFAELADVLSAGDGEANALSRIGVEALASAVRRLNPLDRQLVLLFLEGMSSGEIADVTGLSATNVSTKLSRLRAALRGQLEEGSRDE